MRRPLLLLIGGLAAGGLLGCARPLGAVFNNNNASAVCGNATLEPSEECDGDDLGGATCSTQGFYGGDLGCTSDCDFDLDDCEPSELCGNGLVDPGEECDGDDLDGASCESRGYAFVAGILTCGPHCIYNESDCMAPLEELHEDFEDVDLVHSRWTFTGDWEVGSPAGNDEEPSSFAGSRCIGTNIGGPYSNNQPRLLNMAISPRIDLSNAEVPRLMFNRWIATETCCDTVNVWIKSYPNGSWQVLANPDPAYEGGNCWSGSGPAMSTWTWTTFDLAAYTSQPIRIAFAMETDGWVTFGGAYIDEVHIGPVSTMPNSF